MPVETPIYAKVIGWFKWVKIVWGQIHKTLTTHKRVADLERRLGNVEAQGQPKHHRRCPQCQEWEFRLNDKYRARPEFDGPRFLHEKWLCFNCGHREIVETEEPD